MKSLLKEVLEEIKPSKQEEKKVLKKINSVVDKINKGLKDAKAILGGSGAKGTWLKTFDADIFVKFNYKIYKDKSNVLSDVLEKHLKKKFKKIQRLHGSRDYFRIKKEGYTFEIVPILDIKKPERALNITDISPLHAKWVKKYAKKDEIRLTKQFCKANDFYVAESYIQVFSGYVCEILTIYYGSFVNLLRKSVKWEDKGVIDISKYYKNKKDVFFHLNKSKLHSPLIVIDPVQKERNAAAALSRKQFLKFKVRASLFLKKPSKDFFRKKTIKDEIKKKAGKNKLLTIEVKPKAGKDDVVGCKLLKTFEYIAKRLEKNDFKVLEKEWEWSIKSKAVFYFIIKNEKLSKTKKWFGPPLKVKPYVKEFKKKHKKTFVEGKRIAAYVKRKFMKVEELIKSLKKDDYIKEKVRKIEVK